MPWAKNVGNTINRSETIIDTIYKNRDAREIIDQTVVNSEIIKRDFTKRQQKIILFIKILSFPFGKTSAIIPNMKDWGLCGIGVTKVREELVKLVELRVINWDTELNSFSLLDPTHWLVPYHQGYVDTRAEELFTLNLNDGAYELNKRLKNE